VETVLLFDPHDLSFIHDADDRYRGAVHLGIAAYRDDGLSTARVDRDYQLNLQPAEYRHWLEYGMRLPYLMKLPRPGTWQIRAVIADSASDRMGSTTSFVQIPNVSDGGLALSE